MIFLLNIENKLPLKYNITINICKKEIFKPRKKKIPPDFQKTLQQACQEGQP